MEPDDDLDAQEKRIAAILSDDDLDMEAAIGIYFEHLVKALTLPCEVRGREDFRWEERYVVGPGDRAEYERLKKTHPSFRDRYELLEIGRGWDSSWMLFSEDVCARCRRIEDGREFTLGLAELDATEKASPNWQHIDDYGVWLVNNR